MGVAELRDAFNAVAEPQFTAQNAYLSYEYAHDVQYQRLSFSGIDSSGTPFTCKSDPLPPETNLVLAAGVTANNLIAAKVTP